MPLLQTVFEAPDNPHLISVCKNKMTSQSPILMWITLFFDKISLSCSQILIRYTVSSDFDKSPGGCLKQYIDMR